MIDGIPVGNVVGVGTLFALTFLALIKGWLVVKIHYDDVKEERDYWRATAKKSSEQVDALVGKDNLGLALLHSIDAKVSAAQHRDPPDGEHA
jgi:hypothetical protein